MANNDHATKADLNALREELKGDTATLRAELKGDMAVLRSELKGDMAVLRSELKGDMATMRDELTEVIRDTETKLLKAFYGFAESTQQRLTQHDGYNERLATLERRLTDLEKRVNFPHAS